ncbi:MAG: IS200/IS605 family transposase [Oscillospiraceae bacterium]|jgi:putative transposase|nr:IS200/IS605 family transposase [Oscillospiraceae bacterium]
MKLDTNSLAHTQWECKYHIVFAPKYRRQIIYGKIKQDIGQMIRKLCEYKGVEIIEAEACKDHIHMLVAIPPKYSVSQFMGYLKGKSSLMIFEKYANLKYKYGNRHFWCRGYYVSTVGKNKKAIAEYIRNQLQEDYADDQMSIKEYVDPFTGEPVKEGKWK